MSAKPFQPDERWEAFAQAFLQPPHTYAAAAEVAGISVSTVHSNKKRPGFIKWLDARCNAEIAEARHMADAKLSKCVLNGDVMTAEERGTLKMVYDRDKRINDRVKGVAGGNGDTSVPIEGGLTREQADELLDWGKAKGIIKQRSLN